MADQLKIAEGVGQGASGAFQAIFNLLLGTVAGIDLGMRTTYASLPQNFLGVDKAIIFVATGWVFGGIFFALKGNREEGVMHMLYMLLGRPVALASLWGLIPGASFSLFLILGLTGSVGWEFVFGKKEFAPAQGIGSAAKRVGGAFSEHGLRGVPKAIGDEGKRFWRGPNGEPETEPQRKDRQKKEEKKVEEDTDTYIGLERQTLGILDDTRKGFEEREAIIRHCNEIFTQSSNTLTDLRKSYKKIKSKDEHKKFEEENHKIFEEAALNITSTKQILKAELKPKIVEQTQVNSQIIDILKGFKEKADDMMSIVKKEDIKKLKKVIKNVEIVIKDAVNVLGNPKKRGTKNILNGTYMDIGDNLKLELLLVDKIVEHKEKLPLPKGEIYPNDFDEKDMEKLETATNTEVKEWFKLLQQIRVMLNSIKNTPRIFKQEVEKKSHTA